MEFKSGSKVRVRHQSVVMTVSDYIDTCDLYECCWFDKNDVYSFVRLPGSLLEEVE